MCIDRLVKAMLRILIKRSRTVREVAEETGLIVSHIFRAEEGAIPTAVVKLKVILWRK